MSSFDDQRCAPGRSSEAKSCISLALLIEMAQAYNSHYPNQAITLDPNRETLHPKKYKEYLVQSLQSRLQNKCSDQLCWLEQDFIQKMNQKSLEELRKFTFLPKGPDGRFTWLTNPDIDGVLIQYQQKYPDTFYIGSVAVDFEEYHSPVKDLNYQQLLHNGRSRLGLVINLDVHTGQGTHWVALYTDLNQGIYYFDSVGIKPPKRIRRYMQKLAKFITARGIMPEVRHNKIQHQFEDCDCGVYAINFIATMFKGKVSFEEFCHRVIADKDMNKLRNKYFSRIYDEDSDVRCPHHGN